MPAGYEAYQRAWLTYDHDDPQFASNVVRDVLEAGAPHIRARDATRIAELRKLAEAMLVVFHRTSDGYRARVGQVQIGRWRIALDWENDPDA